MESLRVQRGISSFPLDRDEVEGGRGLSLATESI